MRRIKDFRWKEVYKHMTVIHRRFKLLRQVVSKTITDQINAWREYYTHKLDISVSSRSFLRGQMLSQSSCCLFLSLCIRMEVKVIHSQAHLCSEGKRWCLKKAPSSVVPSQKASAGQMHFLFILLTHNLNAPAQLKWAMFLKQSALNAQPNAKSSANCLKATTDEEWWWRSKWHKGLTVDGQIFFFFITLPLLYLYHPIFPILLDASADISSFSYCQQTQTNSECIH